MSKYPRINGIRKLKKVPMCLCGEVATNQTTVQVNLFRGDDDIYFTCDKHKRDLDYLCSPLK